ncbi:MAG: ribosome recycling factor [Acidobacteriota bacterium]|nr:ribosome recycling factor [Blastocatellia bacterium]MDW8239019.1 ribosome recycling factor [Acidobacteriota bacterium]
MTKAEVLTDAKKRMDAAIEDVRKKLASLRTGRASPAILDHIQVEYYGTPTPLNQVAQIHAPESSLLTIQPYDPTVLPAIERAILSSDLGLTPSNDGRIIRLPIPALTEERRKQLAKVVGEIAEEHRTAIRNIRRDANDQLKKLLKEKLISEDEERRALDDIQKLTDAHIQKINEVAKAKEQEIMHG